MNSIKKPPLLKGGQGRTDEDIGRAASVFGCLAFSLLVWLAVIVVYLYLFPSAD